MNQSVLPHLRPLRYPKLWQSIGYAMMLIVLISMIMPTPQLELQVNYADKWVHVLVFAALGAWAAQIYTPSPALWRAGIGLVAFGASTELIQALIPWRSGDILDFLADSVGVGLGLAIAPTMLGRSVQRFESLVTGSLGFKHLGVKHLGDDKPGDKKPDDERKDEGKPSENKLGDDKLGDDK